MFQFFMSQKGEKIVQNHAVKSIDPLACQAAQCGCPWARFSENITGPPDILRRLDLEELKKEGWFPRAVNAGKATVVTSRPSPELARAIQKKLQINEVDFVLVRPADLRRIIEHNQDINPGFPPTAGRTPLAMVRTYLAGRRSLFALYRTFMAKGRTNLAVVRTGISFIAIGVLFMRILGAKPLLFLFLEAPLLVGGIYMVGRNLLRYLPTRKINTLLPPCVSTTPTQGSTVLEVDDVNTMPGFHRSAEVPGAACLRADWSRLSPVMRRRFLASDRTDFAEERTTLACFRTWLANIRTGLALVRIGSAFAGLGLALIRSLPAGSWRLFDLGLVGIGLLMIGEGLFWYFRGHRSGREGFRLVERLNINATVWDFFFPHHDRQPGCPLKLAPLPVSKDQAPGIWATTGLALERTVLAERRNIMARLRLLMARIRTGFSLVRTGLSLFFVGIVFLVYFRETNMFWSCYETVMMLGGLLLLGDGLLWIRPAEKIKKQFPYCSADMEIALPDYGVPGRSWKKVVFSRGAR